MTMTERLNVPREIVGSNARKLREWQESPHTWREQVETRLLNLRIAEDAMQELREMGAIA